jgi:succinoglycan biosynthesis transport protein ExoP
VALEQIDERLRDPGTVSQELKLALLGNVPLTDNDPLHELGNVASPLSEAYFSIRTTLAFATVHGLPRSFVVTSTQPGEGKSTTALGLAIAIGRTGKRVLLIDADMRSPSAHGLVRSDNSRGLSNLLTGDENFASHVVATELRGVSVLTSGPNPPSAAELLGSDRLQQVLLRLQQSYDHLVIDGPPVLGLADAPLLGRAVEGAVFVIEASRTTLSTIRVAVERLRAVNSHVFGAVVTKIDPTGEHYGYDYRYRKEAGDDAAAA